MIKMLFNLSLVIPFIFLIRFHVSAKEPGIDKRKNALSVSEALKSFTLAEGFVIELVASEEHGIVNPIDLTFDDAGRLWTQTARMYPADSGNYSLKAILGDQSVEELTGREKVSVIKEYYQLKRRGRDQILIIDDPTKTQTAKAHVWADGLALPQSIMPYKKGAYVAHGSEFLFLEDSDGDGKQDKVETVMTGFGCQDTHTMAHSIVRGPGNWFHFSHGALCRGLVKLPKSGQQMMVQFSKNLRFSADHTRLEILNTHKDNNWGYQVKADGQWYSTCANINSYAVMPYEPMTGMDGIGRDMIRSYQPGLPPLHSFRVGGTGISGLAFSEDDGEYGFPAPWNDHVAFLANPITNSINCVYVKRNSDGSVTSKHLPDLLKSMDGWFRPVNIEVGPDGCLYVADWYSKVISHNEVSRTHPDRDRKHGRIWRIRHKSQKTFDIPDLLKVDSKKLLFHLKNGRTLWEKRAAWHQISDRNAIDLASDLTQILLDEDEKSATRVLALWSLEELGKLSYEALKTTVSSSDAGLKRESIRAMASTDLKTSQVFELLKDRIRDPDAMVRSQVLRTLEEIGESDQALVNLVCDNLPEEAAKNRLGGDYERNFERYLSRKYLEGHPKLLNAYLKKELSKLSSSKWLFLMKGLTDKKLQQEFVVSAVKTLPIESYDVDFLNLLLVTGNEVPDMVTSLSSVLADNRVFFDALVKKNLEHLDTLQVAKLYAPVIDSLLEKASADPKSFSQALNWIELLKSPFHSVALIEFFKKQPSEQILKAIGYASFNLRSKEYKQYGKETDAVSKFYQATFTDTSHSVEIRALALSAYLLAQADNPRKNPYNETYENVIKSFKAEERKILVSLISSSLMGFKILVTATEKGLISVDDWNPEVIENLLQIAQGRHLQPYLKEFEKISKPYLRARAKEKEAKKTKIAEYMKAMSGQKGNAVNGKALFNMCLACHQVHGKGVKFAPPLDGSKNRSLEALLTSIIDPDAGVEPNYRLSQFVLINGTRVQGYLISKKKFGYLVGYQGGQTEFLPMSVVSRLNVSKRSFMPDNFGELPKDVLADMISYIQTID